MYRTSTEQKMENLYSFAKLYGYIRYFYPGDEASSLDWNKFLIYGIKQVKNCSNRQQLLSHLKKLFKPAAPALLFSNTGYIPDNPDKKSFVDVFFIHKGFGLSRNSLYRSYRIGRDKVPKKIYFSIDKPAREFVVKDLGSGIKCTIPIVLRLSPEKPHSFPPEFEKLKTILKPVAVDYNTAGDEDTRIASIIYSWNIFKHSYPYFDVVKVNWDDVLRKTLNESLASNKNSGDCFLSLCKMTGKLHDGHGWVILKDPPEKLYLPLTLSWVEDEIIAASSMTAEIKPGDIILEIDRVDAKKQLRKDLQFYSGSKQWKLISALFHLGSSLHVKTRIKISRNKSVKSVVINRIKKSEYFKSRKSKGTGIKKIKKDIFYIHPGIVKMEKVFKALPVIAGSKGLIVDMRGYPKEDQAPLISHMIKEQITSQRWNIPVIRYPDYEEVNDFDTSGRWRIKPKSPYINARIVYLTDGRAISYAESIMGIIEHYKLATIIGSETAGTNGDINTFSTPGGFKFIYTGMKTLKHDGSRHHLTGIKPDVRIKPTIKAIREGRDELLEKAIEIIEN